MNLQHGIQNAQISQKKLWNHTLNKNRKNARCYIIPNSDIHHLYVCVCVCVYMLLQKIRKIRKIELLILPVERHRHRRKKSTTNVWDICVSSERSANLLAHPTATSPSESRNGWGGCSKPKSKQWRPEIEWGRFWIEGAKHRNAPWKEARRSNRDLWAINNIAQENANGHIRP